jgi:hypothetical protein
VIFIFDLTPSSFHRSPVPRSPAGGIGPAAINFLVVRSSLTDAEIGTPIVLLSESRFLAGRPGTILNSALRHRLYRPRGPLAPPRPLFAARLLAPALLPTLRELRLLAVRSEAELCLPALRLVPLAFVANWPDMFLSVVLTFTRTPSLRMADMLPAELLRASAWVLAR